MDLRRHSIIILASLVIGVCLMFCFVESVWPGIVGAIIVMAVPNMAWLTPNERQEIVKEAEQGEVGDTETVKKWKTFDAGTALQLLQKLDNDNASYTVFQKTTVDKVLFGLARFRMVGVILAFLFFLVKCSGQAAMCIALTFVPHGLLRLKYGEGLGSVFDKCYVEGATVSREKAQAVKELIEFSMRVQYLTEFSMTGQFLVRHDSRNTVEDVKTELTFPKRYRGVLGTMITVAVNKVRYSDYAFAYYAIVVRGTDGPDITEDLRTITKDTKFAPERKVDAGNTVYIIKKGARREKPYYTDKNNLKELIGIVAKSAEVLERNFGVEGQ